MSKGLLKKAGLGLTMILAAFAFAACGEDEAQGTLGFGTAAHSTPNKRRLLNYLYDEYGKHMISGQMDTAWTTNAQMDMIARVYADTGKYPALKGFDFMELTGYGQWETPGFNQTDEAIEWWDAKNNDETLAPGKHGIVAFCWHWRMPASGGSHGNGDNYNTTFRIPYQNGWNTSSPAYTLIRADLDLVAAELQKLKDKNIPVLWRPLHEASGGWFWWGMNGAAAYKALWRFMYDYLTNEKGLDNLIWVWNGQNAEWFPGADTVDIVGNDVYHNYNPTDYSSQVGTFMNTYNMVPERNRIVALTENGAIPDPDNCVKDGAQWSFFMTWNDSGAPGTNENNFWSGEHHNTQAHKKKVYTHDFVITLDELPDLTAYRAD